MHDFVALRCPTSYGSLVLPQEFSASPRCKQKIDAKEGGGLATACEDQLPENTMWKLEMLEREGTRPNQRAHRKFLASGR